MDYPPTDRTCDFDTYESLRQGRVVVSDPYRWLEREDAARANWSEVQNRFTEAHLQSFRDRGLLEENLKANFEYTKFSVPIFIAGKWYWSARRGSQQQPVLFQSLNAELPNGGPDGRDDIEAHAVAYFDTNLLSADGTTSMTNWAISPNGNYFAYSIAKSGSYCQKICIRDASVPFNSSNAHEPKIDCIDFSGFGCIVWGGDSNGIYYVHPPSLAISDRPPLHAKVLYHKIGAKHDNDQVLLVAEDMRFVFEVSISTDGIYLLLRTTTGVTGRDKLWAIELPQQPPSDGGFMWTKLHDTFDVRYRYVWNGGPLFYVLTDENADRDHVAKLSFSDAAISLSSQPPFPPPLLNDNPDLFLRQYEVFNNDYAVAVYSHNVVCELYVISNVAPVLRLEPDFVGTITVEPTETGFLASFSSHTIPLFVKEFKLGTKEQLSWQLWRSTWCPRLSIPGIIAEQVWYESNDGTSVPMFIIRHLDTPLNGTAPCIQHGYGGIGDCLVPFFSPTFLTFVHLYGGIIALPNVRGGLEFGSGWRDAGGKKNKINAIEDFLAATRYLIRGQYVAASKVAIYGWSSGAELMSEVICHAPEGMFAGAVLNAGAYDMLRFIRIPPGVFWLDECGDPRKPEDFDTLFSLSPLHNIPHEKALPPTLVLNGQSDVFVRPSYAFKFVAELQHLAGPNSAIQLLAVLKGAGHFEGNSYSNELDLALHLLGFIAQSLCLKISTSSHELSL